MEALRLGAQVSFLRLEVSPWLEWGRSPLSDSDLKGGAKCLPPQSCSSLMWQDPRPPLDQPLRPQTSRNNYIWKAGRWPPSFLDLRVLGKILEAERLNRGPISSLA